MVEVKLYYELESGKNLTEIFKELNKNKTVPNGTAEIFIADEILANEESRMIRVGSVRKSYSPIYQIG